MSIERAAERCKVAATPETDMSDSSAQFFALDQDEVQGAVFQTELGWMACRWRGDRLEANTFGHSTRQAALQSLGVEKRFEELPKLARVPAGLRDLVKRLTRYATRFDDDFRDVPLDLDQLTDFRRRVTQRCREIDPGTTRGYADLARQCGSPQAARAVGTTMARNRFPLIVPCHRVVGANNHLGGYSAPQGLDMKRKLLAAEAAAAKSKPRSA
ncbi:MAG TPA: methylated-DNA--[protein]-cysteine S-methyltransferase [Pirellulaceae bacterium]|nr:methylated-DNA--[protein]-cysteine S-methyltransferase [Pirellulaceae bacterium]